MNLEDVIDPEAVNSVHALQQDEWSLSKPTFGEEGQLEVVGWSGRRKGSGNKIYILKCNKCSQDTDLFGEGFFRSLKGHLINTTIPCGCSKNPDWSRDQFNVLCKRKANEIGFVFKGFIGEWEGQKTRIRMLCEKHGEWSSGRITKLVNTGHGCPRCGIEVSGGKKKPDEVMIISFFESGAFHPVTKFWRSERENREGRYPYWYMSCPDCGETGESLAGDLQKGKRPCGCSPNRQREAYINWLTDEKNMAIAIKFGIAQDSKRRVKDQNRTAVYTLKQHAVYTFPSVQQCKQAERECKKELETGVVLKRDMPDGWTETTWSYNIGKVVDIYKRNGGVLV